MGWYGTCENEEPFPLSSIEDKIDVVLQINEFGTYPERYDPNKPSWKTHPFKELNRGYSYLIIFNIVDSNLPFSEKKVSIPGFVAAKHQGTDKSVYPYVENDPGEGFGRLTTNCNFQETPTPTMVNRIPIWLSFSATDVNTDNQFTLWHEFNLYETDGYSKLTPKDTESLATDLINFQGINLLNIALLSTRTNPNESLDSSKIFASGDVDLSCKECGAILPRLILVDENGSKFIYTDRIYKKDQDCYGSNQLSTKETSNWYEAPVVYNTINAPQKSVKIQELYFDMPNGEKLKFEGFAC